MGYPWRTEASAALVLIVLIVDFSNRRGNEKQNLFRYVYILSLRRVGEEFSIRFCVPLPGTLVFCLY